MTIKIPPGCMDAARWDSFYGIAQKEKFRSGKTTAELMYKK